MPPALFGVLFIPAGMCLGFVTVVLGYVLSQRGVSLTVIAGLVSLRLLPETWVFLTGPLIDVCLTSVRWYVLAIIGLALCSVGFAFAPIDAAGTLLYAALSLVTGIAAVLSCSAASAAMALTTTNAVRGACAGWRQAGWLGGMGLGGGGALWLATHAGGLRVAGLVLAAVYVLCIVPLLIVKVPTAPRRANVAAAGREALGALWRLLRSRSGVLAVAAVTLPAGLGAAAYLLPAVASDWHASADVVATVTGVLAGIASIPGCVLAGYLCDRFPRRTVYIWCALIAAIGEALMAFAPHTPAVFVTLVLVNSFLTGTAYGSVTAIIYDRLEPVGAGTVVGVLGSLASLPVLLVTMILGAVQARAGSSAMLLVEAGLAVASVGIFALLIIAWREPTKVLAFQATTP